MALRFAALGLLAKEPASGYDLLKKFKQSMSQIWPATQSQLYGELNKLAASGLIEVSNVGPRGRKEYSITTEGRAELQRWIIAPEDGLVQRSPVLLRISLLGEVTPSQAHEHVASLHSFVDQELKNYEESFDTRDWQQDDGDFFARAALEYLLRSARMDAAWARWLIDEIDRRNSQSSG
jgi:DNA-binding PadR family transcriptional regulator